MGVDFYRIPSSDVVIDGLSRTYDDAPYFSSAGVVRPQKNVATQIPVRGPCLFATGDVALPLSTVEALLRTPFERTDALFAQVVTRADGGFQFLDPLGRLPRDDDGHLRFPVYVLREGAVLDDGFRHLMSSSSSNTGSAPLVPRVVLTSRVRTVEMPIDPNDEGATTLAFPLLRTPILLHGHVVELIRSNLILRGVVDETRGGLVAFLRLIGAILRAHSVDPTHYKMHLNRVGYGCEIHPTAVVEDSVLGDFVTVGPYTVVRGSFIGDKTTIGSHVICELSSIGSGVRLQRRSMCVASVVDDDARHGGVLQFGYLGRRSCTKLGAVSLDMRHGGAVRVATRRGLVDVDIRYQGAVIDDDSFIGAGVYLAPGRIFPPGSVVLRPPSAIAFPSASTNSPAVAGSGFPS